LRQNLENHHPTSSSRKEKKTAALENGKTNRNTNKLHHKKTKINSRRNPSRSERLDPP